ncbi:MAG TPA: L-rhamnose/proton symporter RhaT [Terriglobia bacterium]|jgi:L-rhamnose-H+ transport protein|nr:L-rhamnose/proton symporter RhaT [Terriglobia bacterium]
MSGNVGVAIGLVLLGGFLQGSFALPMKRMGRWRWENTWLVYSIAGMLILPWIMVFTTVPRFTNVLAEAQGPTIAEVVTFGFCWGVGSTLFGLGITRVGMALTFAIVLGITASLGSLLPLIVFHPNQLFTPQGYALISGLIIVVLGIVVCSLAGHRRERELSSQSAQRGGAGFWLGLVICIFSGIFSAMLNFSFVFGKGLQDASRMAGASPAMSSNLIWALALSAGFLANAGYCIYLLQKNRTWSVLRQKDVPGSYWLGSILMGAVWFFGIAFYGMGATGLGALGAVLGWPLFMAMNITAANVWGALTGEWRGASRRTYGISWAGILVLLIAIYVISHASTL